MEINERRFRELARRNVKLEGRQRKASEEDIMFRTTPTTTSCVWQAHQIPSKKNKRPEEITFNWFLLFIEYYPFWITCSLYFGFIAALFLNSDRDIISAIYFFSALGVLSVSGARMTWDVNISKMFSLWRLDSSAIFQTSTSLSRWLRSHVGLILSDSTAVFGGAALQATKAKKRGRYITNSSLDSTQKSFVQKSGRR